MTQAPQAREAVPPARGKAPASPVPGPAATPPDVLPPLGRQRGVAAPGSPPPVKQPRRAAGHNYRQRPVPEASTGRAGTRTHVAARMSEDRGPDSLDAHVRKYMKDLGLLGYHTLRSLGSERGYPDWTITGPRGVLFRELKRQGRNPTPAQQQWLDALTAAGQDAGVWRPEDLLSGRIARELTAVSRLGGAP